MGAEERHLNQSSYSSFLFLYVLWWAICDTVMIRFSADLVALLSPAALSVVSKLPTVDEPPDRTYEFVAYLSIWIVCC